MGGAATTESKETAATLTRSVLGQEMSFEAAFEFLLEEHFAPDEESGASQLWIGSVGYECFRDNGTFADVLAEHGVERLIDVRDLPISRKRGFAKTALSKALSERRIEYVHAKPLGNPKPFRDLYKSGRADLGRVKYEQYLLGEQRQALAELSSMLAEKRSVLMCVEDDEAVCHRAVIIDALVSELGMDVEVSPLRG